MKIVADSPLIILVKIRRLALLPQLYGSVLITPEVYREVAVAGAGLPGAAEIAAAAWLEVLPLHDAACLLEAQQTQISALEY